MKGCEDMYCYIALDVGGTGIKAGVISKEGRLLTPITHYPSKATEKQEVIVNHLCHIITSLLTPLTDVTLLGVGLAFPGPFDYKNGICLIQGINKYDSLYGLCLKDALHTTLLANAHFGALLAPSFDIRFANDASLYALGETILSPTLSQGRALCFCIGTGLGSAFLEEGKLVTSGEHIPLHGWVYHVPFMDSIIDDYISARGITELYRTLSGHTCHQVKPIADLAYAGDATALECFHQFGQRFATAILPFIQNFQPTHVIIGGQISKSYSLFEQAFLNTLDALVLPDTLSPTLFRLSEDTSISTLLGILKLFI